MPRPIDEVATAEVHRLAADLAGKVQGLEAFARRASLLQQVTAALSRAITVQEVADIVTARSHELFGSTAALLFLFADGGATLELYSFAGVEHERVEPYRRMAVDAAEPLPRAVRTGAPVWLGTSAALLAAYPHLAGVRRDGAPLSGVVALPLRDTREVIGGLAFSFFHAETELDAVQRDFFLTVASQCGLAIERARSFEAERRTNALLQRQQARLAVLAQAAETLSSSLDSRRALVELTRLVVPALVDWCAIDELGPDGAVRRLAVEHRDPAKVALARALAERYPSDPDSPHGVPAVLRTGKTEWNPEIPDELLVASCRDAEHLALMRSLGLTSYAAVPLIARGRVLGALSLVTEGERRLAAEDLRFAEDLARRAALALDNARLYETAEAARAHLHGLFMQAPAAISLLRGPALRFELANEPYQRWLGRSDLVGKTLREALPAPEDAELVARLERVYATGESFTASELPLRDEADERYFNVVYQATRTATGEIDGIATFAFEVSDQVHARRKIEALAADVARSEARMRALVEATAAIVWTATATGELVEVSPSWLAFTGQTAAEYQHSARAAVHPDDLAIPEALWHAAVAAGAPYAAEYRLRRADGSYAYTLARARPVLRADGSVSEYIGCNVDVSELRRAEADAREHAETVSTIHALGQVIAAELDHQKVVQAVTDAATDLSGAQFGAFFYNVPDERGGQYTLCALSGAPREAFGGLPMPRTTAVFAPTFAGQGVLRSDDITKDPRYGRSAPHHGMPASHLPVRSYLAVPVISRSGAVIGGIFLGHADPAVFSERAEALAVGLAAQAAVAMDNARLYGDAQRLIKALEATNRELDQFAYVTSHDLRAPLRGISSLAEWIEEDLGPALVGDLRHKMNLLRGRVQRMEALIQGILDFSRAARTTGKPEQVDLRRLVLEVAELLAAPPPASVEIEGELPVLHTSRVALLQVLLNLIGNALKHAARPDVRVHVSAHQRGELWEFRVRDNGPGIAPEFHDRVWGIFQTLEARDRVENTGIGLAIVKKIVECRGGAAAIESHPGQGATFRFTWPRREDMSS